VADGVDRRLVEALEAGTEMQVNFLGGTVGEDADAQQGAAFFAASPAFRRVGRGRVAQVGGLETGRGGRRGWSACRGCGGRIARLARLQRTGSG